VAPNGVDGRRFRPDASVRERMRVEAGAAPDDVVALFVGGDWDRKGLAVAIEALPHAEPRGRKVVLWVVGHGDEGRFRELAVRCGVVDRVRFFGFRPDTERFCQAADVFVLPSLYEAHPLGPHEAASCGLPVVVTSVNGVAELVGDGQAGAVVERTPAAVGAALNRLARDPAFRAEQSRRARERARAFTWERTAQRMLTLYLDLAEQEQILR
jgi:UDP-glucose:(heptosyl)LPS alpha-1,3-glucosyltransferase